MNSTRLDQKSPGFFAELFDKELVTVHPITAYRGNFNCDDDERLHYGKLPIEGGEFPFNFSMLFPATKSGVNRKYIETAKSVLQKIGEMDDLARQSSDGDEVSDECDLDRDVYLAYVHVEHNRVELQYYWQPFNAEFTAVFSRGEDGSWVFDGI